MKRKCHSVKPLAVTLVLLLGSSLPTSLHHPNTEISPTSQPLKTIADNTLKLLKHIPGPRIRSNTRRKYEDEDDG
jgi:hypothetical protein